MKLPQLAIDNHQFTLIIMILLVMLGVTSFFTMPRSEDPLVAPPGNNILAIFPGASPEDMERLVVDPIEEAISKLVDIKEVNSFTEDGLAVIRVEYSPAINPDDKYEEVVREVNTIRNDLPDDIQRLEIQKWEITSVNMLQLALVSEKASYAELESKAETLKKSLERVAGVRKVEIWAFPEQIVKVSIDLEKMAQMNIPLNQVFGAIQSSNANIPGGSLEISSKKFNVKTSGAYESLHEIRNTIIHARDYKPVYLKDVATVEFDYEDIHYRARFNDKRAIFICAQQKERTNIFHVMEALKAKTAEFERQLPDCITLDYVFDQSQSVARRIDIFLSNLFQGMILVGLVVLLAIGFRASMIVMLAIPMSILIATGFVDLSGYGLQQMTIAAMVIALGLLVDNAIVITENISRFMRKGDNRKDAAVKATQQVGWAVVSATATTVLAFVPMIMMQDITGDFIRSMPVTVVYTLSASLLIALTLTPYLSSKFLKESRDNNRTRVQKILDRFIATHYRKRLDFALSHSKIVIGAVTLVFLGSLALFPIVGVSFFPKAEKPILLINIDTQGTSLNKTDEIARLVESELRTRDNIKHFASNIGHGNPRIYYNAIPKNEKSTHAQIYVQLKEYNEAAVAKLIDDLRKVLKFPNAKIEVKEFEQGPYVEAPIAVRVLGDNLDNLNEISQDVERIIHSTEGTVNVDNPLRTSAIDLHININREKAGMLGLSLLDIDRTIRASIAGLAISQYRDKEGKEYDVVVRLPSADKPTFSDLEKIYLTSIYGAQIPLQQVAHVEFQAGPTQIHHFNMERNVTITADVLGDYAVNKVTQAVIAKLDNYDWPNGYRYVIGGELESREESFGGMTKAIIIAMLAIFGVLVLQFRSFSQPLIVFAAIPLAVIGSIIALLITGNSFSFTAFIGLTSLVGIVINNSIILVTYTNQLRDEGKDLITALKEAGETRFTPIILTVATTVGGLLPLTLRGGTLWAPMGWTIIGGLLVSTFLTLLVVPVLYSLFLKS